MPAARSSSTTARLMLGWPRTRIGLSTTASRSEQAETRGRPSESAHVSGGTLASIDTMWRGSSAWLADTHDGDGAGATLTVTRRPSPPSTSSRPGRVAALPPWHSHIAVWASSGPTGRNSAMPSMNHSGSAPIRSPRPRLKGMHHRVAEHLGGFGQRTAERQHHASCERLGHAARAFADQATDDRGVREVRMTRVEHQ